jgi:molybdate transport system substrate-binding protein
MLRPTEFAPFAFFTAKALLVLSRECGREPGGIFLKISMPAEITVLSAGAVQPGLVQVIDAFRRETGDEIKVTFATAPTIRKRLSSGEIADILIAPPELLDELEKTAGRNVVGRIGVGVAIRDGAPIPKLATVDEFKQSLLSAESIVYNQASTGIYLESLFERLGISAQLKAKTTRYADFAAVRDHVTKGTVNEIGLGATTVIIESASKGLKFVGPLPAEIQNYTTYVATVTADSPARDAAVALLQYLSSPKAKAIFASVGIE